MMQRRKLKILIALTYYRPHSTGLTIHAQQVAEALARRGHEVTVVASRHSPDLPRHPVMENGVRVVRLWAPLRLSRGMVMPGFPWRLFQLMRQHDIISIHTPMLETALISLISRLTGTPVVPTHHGDLYLPDGLLNPFIIKLMHGMFSVMGSGAPCIIAYSEDYRRHSYYLKPFRDKVATVYPPVILPAPEPEQSARMRREWQLDDGPVIGFSGRFAHEKRPDLLIKSLDTVNKHYPTARIVFAGEYQINYETTWRKHRDLVAKYQSQLIFLGLLGDRQELANFYAACDVLAMPSHNDNFPLALIESMLCGTPVVMSDIYGGRVPVQVTGMGKLAKSGDAESVGDAIVSILRDREAFVKSRAFIEGIFSLEETIDRYEAIFLRHASARRG